jgi:glycosyltransferase involved in cell wall biosynthesis
MMNIFYLTPYSLSKKIGEAYNQYCSIIPNDDDWICLLDADCMLLSPEYGRHINEVLMSHGNDFDLFTSYATRIGNKQQQWESKCDVSGDMRFLYQEVMRCENLNWGKVTQLSKHVSGCLLLFKKRLWKEFNFPITSDEGSMLGIDKLWTKTLLESGKKIARMDGILLVHYYRLLTGRSNKDHLLTF